MSNVLIARPTLSDAATLSGDNVNVNYPIENALTQQPREKVRATATTLGVSIDMNAPVASLTPYASTSPSPIVNVSEWNDPDSMLLIGATKTSISPWGDLFATPILCISAGAATHWAYFQSQDMTAGTPLYFTYVWKAGTGNKYRMTWRSTSVSPVLQTVLVGTLNPDIADQTGDDAGQIKNVVNTLIDTEQNIYRTDLTFIPSVTDVGGALFAFGPGSSTSGDNISIYGFGWRTTSNEIFTVSSTPSIDFVGCLYNNASTNALWRVRGSNSAAAFDSMADADKYNAVGHDIDMTAVGWTLGSDTIRTLIPASYTYPRGVYLTDNVAGGTGSNVLLQKRVIITDATEYEIYAWVRADLTTKIGIATSSYSADINDTTKFDLSAVTVDTVGSAHNSGTISVHPDYSDIYRIGVKYGPSTTSPVDLNGFFRIRALSDAGSTTVDLDGTNGFYVYSAGVDYAETPSAWGYDSLLMSMWNESSYTNWDRVHSLLLPVTAQAYRYWRIDFEGIDSTFEFGRLYLSEKYQPTRNVDIGLKLAHSDASFGVDTAGAHYRRQGRKWREMSMRYSFRYEAEAYDDWVEFDLAVGTGGDCFVSIDPTERIMNRSIYCYPASLGEVDHGVWNVAAASNLHTKGYTFREFEKP